MNDSFPIIVVDGNVTKTRPAIAGAWRWKSRRFRPALWSGKMKNQKNCVLKQQYEDSKLLLALVTWESN